MLLSQQSAYIEKCDSKIPGTAAWDFSPRSSLAPAFQTSTTKPWVKTSWAQKGWNRMEINWRVEVPWVLLIELQEPDGKFYFSEILLGLEYLHSQQVTLSMRSDDDTICISGSAQFLHGKIDLSGSIVQAGALPRPEARKLLVGWWRLALWECWSVSGASV